MIHKKILQFSLAVSLLTLSLPIISLAATVNTPDLQIQIPGLTLSPANVISSTTIQTSWLAEYIAAVYKYGIGIIGIVAMLAVAVGGALWVVSSGVPARVSAAKSWVTNGLIGLALGLGSYLLLATINYDLVNYQSMNIAGINSQTSTSTATNTTTATNYNAAKNFTTYDSLLAASAAKWNLDCTLLKAIMLVESSGNPNKQSPKGANGLMQVLGASFDPAQNINSGASFLDNLFRTACNGSATGTGTNCNTGDLQYVIAAYNGGPGCNKASVACPGQTYWQCTQNNGYAQVRNYVVKVQNTYQTLKANNWGC